MQGRAVGAAWARGGFASAVAVIFGALVLLGGLVQCGGNVVDGTNPGSGSDGSAGTGGVSDLVACSRNSDCAAYSTGSAFTTAACDAVPLGSYTNGVVAINKDKQQEYCGCVNCGDTLPSAPTWYVATCAKGVCRVVDLQTDSATSCKGPGPGSCVLRTRACCECAPFDKRDLISVADVTRLKALVCDPGQQCGTSCYADYSQWSTLQAYLYCDEALYWHCIGLPP